MSKQQQMCNNQHFQKYPPQLKVLGRFPINYLLFYFIPLLIFACFFNYFTAVFRKQEQPFPHTTITNMSRFYPQDLVFRYLMLPAGGFINLIYFVLFKWMLKLKEDTSYPSNTQQWLQPLGQLSIAGFYGAVATIDGGSLPFIHIIGACFFFLMLFFISTTITFVLQDIRNWNTSVLDIWSMRVKLTIASYLLLIFTYCTVGANISEQINQDNIYVVIFEWNLVIGGLLWLLSFTHQWKNINISLKADIQQFIKQQQFEN